MPHIVGRVADPTEWSTLLVGTQLARAELDPDNSVVVVVEVDGAIAGCWAALACAHVEGLELMNGFRGDPGVARALLTTMTKALEDHGIREVLTQAVTPEVEAMIQKIGGLRVPGTSWVIKV